MKWKGWIVAILLSCLAFILSLGMKMCMLGCHSRRRVWTARTTRNRQVSSHMWCITMHTARSLQTYIFLSLKHEIAGTKKYRDRNAPRCPIRTCESRAQYPLPSGTEGKWAIPKGKRVRQAKDNQKSTRKRLHMQLMPSGNTQTKIGKAEHSPHV